VEFDFDLLKELNLVAHVFLLDFSVAYELGDELVDVDNLLSAGTVTLESLIERRDVPTGVEEATSGA